jgi:hypothetical protein
MTSLLLLGKQTGFTGFFRICRIEADPEKSCKSSLNFVALSSLE